MSRSDLVKAMLKRREEKRQLESVRREIETEAAPPILVSPPRPDIDEPTEEGIDFLASTTVQPAAAGQEPNARRAEPAAAAVDNQPEATSMDEDRTPSLGPRRAPSPIANPTGKKKLSAYLHNLLHSTYGCICD